MQKYILIGVGVWAAVYFLAPANIQTLNGMVGPYVGCVAIGAASGFGAMYFDIGGAQSGPQS